MINKTMCTSFTVKTRDFEFTLRFQPSRAAGMDIFPCVLFCVSTSTGVTTQWAILETSSVITPTLQWFEPREAHCVSSWMLPWLKDRQGKDKAGKGRGGVMGLFQQHWSLKQVRNSSTRWSPLCSISTQCITVKKHSITERLAWICSWHRFLRFVLWSTRALANTSSIYLACIDPCCATVISCL